MYRNSTERFGMEKASVTFTLDTRWSDSVDEADAGEVLATPDLHVYCSPADAAADREGLDIVETLEGYGDLWFFASDGSPLKAHFSKEPYINFEKNTYFPGIYSLEPGAGENLQDALTSLIAKNRSPHTQIIVGLAANNEVAKQFGWSDTEAMKEGTERALQILPPDMATRVVFEPITNEWITRQRMPD